MAIKPGDFKDYAEKFQEFANGSLVSWATGYEGYKKGSLPKESWQKLSDLLKAAAELQEAATEFVERVDKGEVLSKYTYGKFKGILERLGWKHEQRPRTDPVQDQTPD